MKPRIVPSFSCRSRCPARFSHRRRRRPDPSYPWRLPMAELRIRPAARAIVLDPDDRILLVRFEFPRRDVLGDAGWRDRAGRDARGGDSPRARRGGGPDAGRRRPRRLDAPPHHPVHRRPVGRAARAVSPRPHAGVHAAAGAELGAAQRRVRVRAALVDAGRARGGGGDFAPRRLPELVRSLLRDAPAAAGPSRASARRLTVRVRLTLWLVNPCQRLAIGSRQSRPNARGRSLTPGGAWRRLYSARSTSASTLSTVAGSNSASSSSRERSSSTYASSTGSSSS